MEEDCAAEGAHLCGGGLWCDGRQYDAGLCPRRTGPDCVIIDGVAAARRHAVNEPRDRINFTRECTTSAVGALHGVTADRLCPSHPAAASGAATVRPSVLASGGEGVADVMTARDLKANIHALSVELSGKDGEIQQLLSSLWYDETLDLDVPAARAKREPARG